MIFQITTVMGENLEWDCQPEHVALGINCTKFPPNAYIFVVGKILSDSGTFKKMKNAPEFKRIFPTTVGNVTVRNPHSIVYIFDSIDFRF